MNVSDRTNSISISNEKQSLLGKTDTKIGQLKHWVISNPIASASMAAGLVGFGLGAGVAALGLATLSVYSPSLKNRNISVFEREKRDISGIKDLHATHHRPKTNNVVLYTKPNLMGKNNYFKDQQHGKDHGHKQLRETYHSAALDFRNPDTLVVCNQPNFLGECSEHISSVMNKVIKSFYFKSWKEIECPAVSICPPPPTCPAAPSIQTCPPCPPEPVCPTAQACPTEPTQEPMTPVEGAIYALTQVAYLRALHGKSDNDKDPLLHQLSTFWSEDLTPCELKEANKNIKAAWDKGKCEVRARQNNQQS